MLVAVVGSGLFNKTKSIGNVGRLIVGEEMAELEIVQVTKEDLEKFIHEAIKKEFSQFEPLLETLVFRQKDVAPLAKVSPSTVANKIAGGLVPYLSQDGSRKNYVTLKTVNDLKPRVKRSRQ